MGCVQNAQFARLINNKSSFKKKQENDYEEYPQERKEKQYQTNDRSQNGQGKEQYTDNYKQKYHDKPRQYNQDRPQRPNYKEQSFLNKNKQPYKQNQGNNDNNSSYEMPEWKKKIQEKYYQNYNQAMGNSSFVGLNAKGSTLEANLSQELQQYNAVKNFEIDLKEVSMYDYLKLMGNQKLSDSTFQMGRILIGFIQRLYKNEGVDDEVDDVFRIEHKKIRLNITKILTSRPEFMQNLEKLENKILQLPHNQISTLLTIYVKGGIVKSEQEIKQVFKQFKLSLIEEKNEQNALFSIVIAMRLVSKLVIHKENQSKQSSSSHQLLIDFIQFCKKYFEIKYDKIRLGYCAQILKSLAIEQKDLDSQQVLELTEKIILTKQEEIPQIVNNDIFNLIDVVCNLNKLRIANLPEKSQQVIKILLNEINVRLQNIEESNLQFYELANILKALTNKKGDTMSLEQIPELVDLLRFCSIILIRHQDSIKPTDFVQIMHSLSRLNYQYEFNKLEPMILKLAQNREKSNLSLNPCFRLGIACIENWQQLSPKTVNLTIEMAFNKFQEEFNKGVSKAEQAKDEATPIYIKSQRPQDQIDEAYGPTDILKKLTVIIKTAQNKEFMMDLELLKKMKQFRQQGNLQLGNDYQGYNKPK
eukprot:403347759